MVPRAKLVFVAMSNMSAPASSFGDVIAALVKDPLEDVGLETGSSYSDVCVIARHAVPTPKLGFMTTSSVSASFSDVGDITEALIRGPTQRCRPRNRK